LFNNSSLYVAGGGVTDKTYNLTLKGDKFYGID